MRAGLVWFALVAVLTLSWAVPCAAESIAVAGTDGQVVGSGDGRIHIIPTLSAKSIKNGDRASIQAVVKALNGVAKVEARIEREPGQDTGPDALQSGPVLDRLLGLPVATLELNGAPMNLGGANAAGTIGMWQTQWTATGLEEGYYRIAITVTDRVGHSYTDRSLIFTDPIAGNNAIGTTTYQNTGMTRLDAAALKTGEDSLYSAVIDAANGYAYFGAHSSPGIVVKVALGSEGAAPTRVGALTLNPGEDNLYSAVIDTANGYAYFGTETSPGIVVKVALGSGAAAPTRVGAVTLSSGESYLYCAVIDSANGYAYFGTQGGRVVKVAVGSGAAAPTRVGAATPSGGEYNLYCAVIDTTNGYAYFGAATYPGIVMKVALGSGAAAPTRVGSVTLNSGENYLSSAAIDTTNSYAYFGTETVPGIVVKVALGSGTAAPTRVSSLTLNSGEDYLFSATADATNGYAYFGSQTSVIKVAMTPGVATPTRVGAVTLTSEYYLQSAVIDTARGYAYFGTDTHPGIVAKVTLGSGAAAPSRVGAVTFNSGEDHLVSAAIDTGNGYAYFGTGASPGQVVKVALGVGAKAPVRVGSVTLNSGENYPASAVIDVSNGYAYFGTTTAPGIVVKIALGAGATAPTRVGAVRLNSYENYLYSGVIDAARGYAYFGAYANPGRVVKVALGSGSAAPTRVGAVTLNSGENALYSAAIDTSNGYAYFGTDTSPGIVVKVALGSGSTVPSRVGAVTLNSGEERLYSAAIDTSNGYAYFGTNTIPGRLVKVALGSGAAAPARVGAVTLNSGEPQVYSIVLDAANGYGYLGVWINPGRVVKVALGSGAASPTRIDALTLSTSESYTYCGVIDVPSGYAYFGTYTYPGRVVRLALSEKGFIKGTKVTMPEPGSASSVSLYSHAAAGNVRLALYDNSASPNLLWQSNSTANTAAGAWLTIPISSGTPSSLSMTAGTYWLAWQTDTVTPVASYTAGSSGNGFYVPMAYASCPATLNAANNATPTTSTEKWSEYLTYTAPPAAPSSPGSTDIATDMVTWAWADNSSDETGFKVYADPGSSAPTTLQTTTAANATSWQHTCLSPNVQYAFQVCATNAVGDSAKTSMITAYTLAATPVSPVVSGATVHSLNVAIGIGDGNSSSTVYAISVSPDVSGNTWVQANGTLGSSAVFQTASTWGTTTVSGLAEYTSYSFSVTAQNGAGTNTSAGSSASGTTLDGTAPLIVSQPVSVSANLGSPASFSVVATDASALTYQWRRNNAPIAAATTAAYTLSGVTGSDNGAAYDCVVTDSANNVTVSSVATLTVLVGIRVSASPSSGGTADGGSSCVYGTTATVAAYPNTGSGYYFVNWTENGSVASTSASYSFSATAARDLVANFSNLYTLTVNNGSGSGTYASGTLAPISANAAPAGQHFSHWSGASTITNASSAVTTVLIQGDTSVMANYAADAASITSVTPDTGTAGDKITNARTLTLLGTASGASGFSVQVYDGATLLGSATGTTNWTFTTPELDYGSHTFTARTNAVASSAVSMQVVKVVADAGAERANGGLPWNVKTGTNCWLDGSGSYDPDGATIGYAWSFAVKPDGSALSDADIHGADTASPWFVPDVDGLYTLKLTVLDSEDAAYDQSATVEVLSSASNNVNAVVAPREVNTVLNEAVKLDGARSVPAGVTYAWSATGGTLSAADASTTEFSATAAGDYTVSLAVSKGWFTAVDNVVVHVVAADADPNADAGRDQVAVVQLGVDAVQLDASGSTPGTCSWAFVSYPGAEAPVLTGGACGPQFVPASDGVYVLRLTVTAGAASASDDVMVTAVSKARFAKADSVVANVVSNRFSTLDRRTRNTISSATVTATSTQPVLRLRQVVWVTKKGPGLVTMPAPWVAGDGSLSQGHFYLDLGSIEVAAPNAVQPSFTYPSNVTMSFTCEPWGIVLE